MTKRRDVPESNGCRPLTINFPASIGDPVYAVKKYNGRYVVRQGMIAFIELSSGMEPIYTVYTICKGKWMHDLFPHRQWCQEECDRRNNNVDREREQSNSIH